MGACVTMGGIRIHKQYIATHSSSCKGVEPEFMNWKEEKIDEYLKTHQMPDDPNYDEDALIYDLTESGGTLTFSEELKPETIEFIEGLMNWLETEK